MAKPPALSRSRAFGLSWLLLGWIAQLLLPVVHQQWMASRPRDAAVVFCGLASTRAAAGLAALAPPELKAAIRRASRHPADANCALCASVHAPAALGSALPVLPFLIRDAVLSPARAVAPPARQPLRSNRARGPPGIATA